MHVDSYFVLAGHRPLAIAAVILHGHIEDELRRRIPLKKLDDLVVGGGVGRPGMVHGSAGKVIDGKELVEPQLLIHGRAPPVHGVPRMHGGRPVTHGLHLFHQAVHVAQVVQLVRILRRGALPVMPFENGDGKILGDLDERRHKSEHLVRGDGHPSILHPITQLPESLIMDGWCILIHSVLVIRSRYMQTIPEEATMVSSADVIAQMRSIAEEEGVERLILFGSRARGTNLPKSDYDIAVSGCASFNRLATRFDEELWTLLDIDLVDLDSGISPALIKEIERDGKVIYEKVR